VRDVVAATAWAVSDTKVTAPLYNGHFYHTGITYGGNQAAAIDSGVVVAGTAIASS
jgi:hypothetical protein